MSSKTPAESPPDYFVDRSPGKVTAGRLRADGLSLHLIADAYSNDAADIPDERWIAEGCRRGWALLTEDKAVRAMFSQPESLLLLQQLETRPLALDAAWIDAGLPREWLTTLAAHAGAPLDG